MVLCPAASWCKTTSCWTSTICIRLSNTRQPNMATFIHAQPQTDRHNQFNSDLMQLLPVFFSNTSPAYFPPQLEWFRWWAWETRRIEMRLLQVWLVEPFEGSSSWMCLKSPRSAVRHSVRFRKSPLSNFGVFTTFRSGQCSPLTKVRGQMFAKHRHQRCCLDKVTKC